MTPDEAGIIMKLAEIGRREIERRDGVRDDVLRDVLYRFMLEVRARRWTPEPSMLASVSYLDDWRPAPSLRGTPWRPCSECGRSTDRPRRGLCDRCRKREDRARAG